jgi:uncharacterized protein YlxW (UPF0749 family)
MSRSDPHPSTFVPDLLQDIFAHPLDPGYADATRRRQMLGPRRRPRVAKAMTLATLAATGFLLAMAYGAAVAAAPSRNTAHAGLAREVEQAQARTDELQRRSDDLGRQVDRARAGALSADEFHRIREQEAATGFGAVRGDGVTVQLSDAATPIDPTTGKPTGAEVSRVLDVDLQNVVNGLWAAGAEAVAVNGQRLTATSTIRAAGSAILVDFRPVTSPYLVSAIGPADLTDRFNRSRQAELMRDVAQRYGLGFATTHESRLRLDAAADVPLRYAHPLSTASPGATR